MAEAARQWWELPGRSTPSATPATPTSTPVRTTTPASTPARAHRGSRIAPQSADEQIQHARRKGVARGPEAIEEDEEEEGGQAYHLIDGTDGDDVGSVLESDEEIADV